MPSTPLPIIQSVNKGALTTYQTLRLAAGAGKWLLYKLMNNRFYLSENAQKSVFVWMSTTSSSSVR